MKLRLLAILVGSLVLAGALPIHSQTVRTNGQNLRVQLAAADPADRNTYMQTARANMTVWSKKMQEFGERTQAKVTEAKIKATNELNEAWTETKAAAARLEVAAAEDWESAKTSFKRASDKLAVAWQNIGAHTK
jgi:hypothetical protein